MERYGFQGLGGGIQGWGLGGLGCFSYLCVGLVGSGCFEPES